MSWWTTWHTDLGSWGGGVCANFRGDGTSSANPNHYFGMRDGGSNREFLIRDGGGIAYVGSVTAHGVPVLVTGRWLGDAERDGWYNDYRGFASNTAAQTTRTELIEHIGVFGGPSWSSGTPSMSAGSTGNSSDAWMVRVWDKLISADAGREMYKGDERYSMLVPISPITYFLPAGTPAAGPGAIEYAQRKTRGIMRGVGRGTAS